MSSAVQEPEHTFGKNKGDGTLAMTPPVTQRQMAAPVQLALSWSSGEPAFSRCNAPWAQSFQRRNEVLHSLR